LRPAASGQTEGWEKRGELLFYYRSVRHDGKTRKVFIGGGLVGQVAASLDA